LAADGNELLEKGRPREALRVFRRGLELIPEPRSDWSATLWFLTAVGDAEWQTGDHESGRATWRDALLTGGIGNPFVHLRRGQTLLELGAPDEAGNELLRALLIAGTSIFDDEDPKYLAFITSRAKPPPGRRTWHGWAGVDPDDPRFAWLFDDSGYTLTRR
jgi:hypothetical protein